MSGALARGNRELGLWTTVHGALGAPTLDGWTSRHGPGCWAAVLLRRSDDELQIGLDPGWRLPDRGAGWQRVLARLDGRRSWAQIVAESSTVDVVELARLLESLARVGLVALETSASGPRVRLIGTSQLAVAIADRLRQEGRPIERVDSYETASSSRPVGLAVVVAAAPEIDRAVAADLLRRDVAHLLVRFGPAAAVVGPLVVPGRTGCLHCTDLTRRDVDPGWPMLLDQLSRLRPSTRAGDWAAGADWTVGVTVTQALAFLAGRRPETWGATLELTPPRYELSWRAWPPHPECGCRWLVAG